MVSAPHRGRLILQSMDDRIQQVSIAKQSRLVGEDWNANFCCSDAFNEAFPRAVTKFSESITVRKPEVCSEIWWNKSLEKDN